MNAPTACTVTYSNGTQRRTKKFWCLEIAEAFIAQVCTPNGYTVTLKIKK